MPTATGATESSASELTSAMRPVVESSLGELVISSSAPWMEYALGFKDKLKESKDHTNFMELLYAETVKLTGSAATPKEHRPPEPPKASTKTTDPLDELDRVGPYRDPTRSKESFLSARKATRDSLERANPQIDEFLKTTGNSVVTDGPKGKWDVGVTPWCAAFVNWCLMKAGASYLGSARAADWLKFGVPLPLPLYGAIVVTVPLTSTGNGSGHVGFCYRAGPDKITLLGGNQSDGVNSELHVEIEKVRGFRWPRDFSHLLPKAGRAIV